MLRPASSRPICIDLFAGAGGLSLGFEQAGFDIAAAVEFDPIHAATHQFNFPYSKIICRDIRQLHGKDIRREAAIGGRPVDVLIGGPPCQGFSLIGHRVLDDPRNALVFHFLRLVKELRPRCFLMENVPGMVTGVHTELFDQLLRRLRSAGYDVHSKVLNAAHFGVPQNRSRVFIVGARGKHRIPDFPESETVLRAADGVLKRESPLHRLPACPSVSDALADLPDIDEWEELLESDELTIPLPPGSRYASLLRGDALDGADSSYRRCRPEKVLAGCLRAEHTALSRKRFDRTKQGETEPISRFYRLPWMGVSNTLRSGTATDRGAFTSPRPIHPLYPRCISVREAARLHSFPDWFWFHQTKWHGFRQIGNSVPPLLARAVASEVAKILAVKPSRPRRILSHMRRELIRFDMTAAAEHFGVDPRVIPQRLRKGGAK
jgi:DNA (cytosine-5)-methyltransferase 1